MEQKNKRMIEFFLNNAGASIRYRVKKEILGNITEEEEYVFRRDDERTEQFAAIEEV